MDESVSPDEAYRLVYLARSVDEVVRRYMTRLCRLQDEGFEVHVLAGAGAGFDELAAQGIHAKKIPVRSAVNVAGLAGAYFIIQAYLFEKRPVLVHSFGHRLAWQGTFAAEQAGVPAIFSTLDFHWLEEDPIQLPLGPLALLGMPRFVDRAERGINKALGWPYRRSMREAYRWLAGAVDRYVVTPEFDLKLAQDLELASPKKLEMAIGGAGVDLERFSLDEEGDPDREEARRSLGLPGHWRQVVGWVGPVTRRHGAEELTAAMESLRHSHPSAGWLVVPRGKMADGQRRRLRRLEREGFVQVLQEGKADARLYRAMDLFAWGGRASTPHDPIMEAAAMAVPTVGFDTPGARSLIENGQTGRLVFDETGASLASGLARLLNDPTYLRELGWRARTRANLRFARRAVDDQILRLYDRVLRQKMTPS